ncbi:MFS transporter, UMF1 family [Hymenobacter gelipurpurascens]|uniref:MFS transporter, UMF1 family n=1 Tax=Hymenobacter gelipurpurascens TaxID=89968 RepID=A0A212TJC0_9BACT|nr:MFS transporter [Hymenobacter gelipurpurascens]SNC65980.1 MFS transporter, UMF1 family [Hymenobacter gelipurpurascens]
MTTASATAPETSFADIPKDDKRITRGWTFYDWANSVYPLVITSSIFPIYWGAITKTISPKDDVVSFLGFQVPGSSLLTYAISAAFLLVALISPFLTSLADFSGRKKLFMQIFCYIGAFSCAALFFFTPDTLTLSTFIFIAATFGFSGSIVFYNSYLPLISSEENYDSLSARGFSMGYIGSVVLLIICLLINQFPEMVGIDASTPEGARLPARISFLLTGLWWAGFAQIPFFTLPADPGRPADAVASESGWLLNGFHELGKVWAQLKHLPNLKRFLLAYFTYNMGVQTVMYVATIFGDKELHLESTSLIITILLLQVVGILGAYLFAKLSERIGNTRALSWSVFIWMCICVAGYFVQAGWSFYALASVIGLTMGAIQSLSRSTYSKIIPENTPNTAAFFSFFDVTEKLSIVIGTAVFGIIAQITGSMRNSILSLIVFFILGLLFLLTLRGKKLRDEPSGETVLGPPPATPNVGMPAARQ